MKPIWGPGPKPSVIQLYGLVARESIHRGKAGNKALPGYESAYYVEDAIHRWFGVEDAFGKYSITGVHKSMEAKLATDNNLVQAPELFNQDPSKVNILSPVNSSESTRRVPSSSQQGRRRGGTFPRGGPRRRVPEMAKVVWKSGKKGGKKRPTCPKGFRLRRVGKRLMCVKS